MGVLSIMTSRRWYYPDHDHETKSPISYQRVFPVICGHPQTFSLSSLRSLLSLLLLELSFILFYHSQTAYLSPHTTRSNLKILLFCRTQVFSYYPGNVESTADLSTKIVPKCFPKLETISSWGFLCSIEDTVTRF